MVLYAFTLSPTYYLIELIGVLICEHWRIGPHDKLLRGHDL
jgi:hypothetical protein